MVGEKPASTIWESDSFPLCVFSVDSIPSFLRNDTLFQYIRLCKTLRVLKATPLATGRGITDKPKTVLLTKTPFLTVHGNVQYDFLYQSFVDTPYYQHALRQHSLRTTLHLLFRDRYPLDLTFSSRQSNSPYFINSLNLGLQFNRLDFERRAKAELLKKVEDRLWQLPEFKRLTDSLRLLNEAVTDWKTYVQSPGVLQKLVEEKETAYYRMLQAGADSLNSVMDGRTQIAPDVAYNRFVKGQRPKALLPVMDWQRNLADEQKMELDSLERQVSYFKQKVDWLRDSIGKQVIAIRQKINKASNLEEARKAAVATDAVREKQTKAEQIFSNIRSIGVGRSLLNLSELTVWNASLTGVSVEYTPGVYTAFAAGKIDYGFRDFWGRNNQSKSQHLIIGRFGIGNVEKKALILSVFAGKKYNYGHSLHDTISTPIPVTGFSLEGIIKHDAYTFLSAEVAKTNRFGSDSSSGNYSTKNLFNPSDRSNLGLSIKGQMFMKSTGLRISGFLRQTGENFQSFSLFTYRTNQIAWNIRAEQPLLKGRVAVSAALRRNDFTNPFTEKSFRTSTIFKSIEATVRFPKWPVLSAAYHPGSQLYVLDHKRIREDAYYITNISAFYTYRAGEVRMLSSFVYNDFSSRGTDTGFIAYRGRNYSASHQFLLGVGSVQGTYTYTDQAPMKFHSFEASGDVAIHKLVKMNGSAKYHHVPMGQRCWGGRAGVQLEAGRAGHLQFQYEKIYLPTLKNTLYPVETGSVSWINFF